MGENLRRYAWWQLRDFGRERAIALMLVGVLLGFTVVGPARAVGALANDSMVTRVLSAVLTQIAFISSFIALNGIVSNDRKQGYYRFLFSKPVSIPSYYAQLFVVYFVGYMVVCAMLMGVFSIFAAPVSPWRPLAFCALVFLSVGGIAFFISSLFRHDWPILAGVILGSTVLHSLWRFDEGWRRMVLSVLPPFDRLTGALPELLSRGAINTNSAIWLLGYSAVFFAAGLFVLRRRPFS